MAEQDKEIAGYRAERIRTAVRTLRQSQGIYSKTLAKEADVQRSAMIRFETGKGVLSEEELHRVAKVLGAGSLDDLMHQYKAQPEINRDTTVTAIIKIAKYKRLSIAELEREAGISRGNLANFVRLHQSGESSDTTLNKGVETLFFAVKQLGFKSVGDIIVAAAKLPDDLNDPVYNPPPQQEKIAGYELSSLGEAVKKNRISQGVLQKALAVKAGIGPALLSKFENGERKLSEEQVLNIANKLGFNTIVAMVDEARTIPKMDRGSVVLAIIKASRFQEVSIPQLERRAKLARGSIAKAAGSYDVSDLSEEGIMKVENAFLAAKHLGFTSVSDMLTRTASLPNDLQSSVYQRTGSADIQNNTAEHAVYGHWTSLVEASRVAARVLPEKTNGRE